MNGKAGDLRPNPSNPRKITPERLKILAKTMAEFGDLGGIVVSTRSGTLISGHQRVKVLDGLWPIVIDQRFEKPNAVGTVAEGRIETPWGPWAYREVDFDEAKEAAARLAANEAGGEWDYPKLKDILTELNDGCFDLDLTGFGEEGLKGLADWAPTPPTPEPAAPPESAMAKCPECGAEFMP